MLNVMQVACGHFADQNEMTSLVDIDA